MPKYFVRCLENLAVRGGMLWVGQMLAQWADRESLLVLYLLCIMATAPRAWRLPAEEESSPGARLQGCHVMLSLQCAQRLVDLLLLSLSALTGGGVLLTGAVLASGLGGSTEHVLGDMCAFGFSLLVTTQMERWLDGSSPTEVCCTYAGLFVLLQCLLQGLQPKKRKPDDDHRDASSFSGALLLQATQQQEEEEALTLVALW
jgi:hypothetical protein